MKIVCIKMRYSIEPRDKRKKCKGFYPLLKTWVKV